MEGECLDWYLFENYFSDIYKGIFYGMLIIRDLFI